MTGAQMTARPSIRELRQLYDQGGNVLQALREAEGIAQNSRDAILLAYDLQSGSYTRALDDPIYREKHERYTAALARILDPLGAESMLEAGVGEATTLCNTVAKFARRPTTIAGFDLSWSRIDCAQRFAAGFPSFQPQLCAGDLFRIPAADAAFDIVFTSHAVEPNHGREREALHELHRVARRWLVLFEPSYELGSEATRRRMEHHGYCRGLPALAQELGMKVIAHRLLDFTYHPENQTAVLIIQKDEADAKNAPGFACPECRTPLVAARGNHFCEQCGLVFPVIGSVPCLLPGKGILATRFLEERS
jgi:hypothetical protein